MDEHLDDELKKRIREVFDNFDDTSADEGWILLREKFPEKARRRPIAWIWWSSVAASLLLFLGILWFKNTQVKENKPRLTINKKLAPKVTEPMTKIPADSAAFKQAKQDLLTANNGHATQKTHNNGVYNKPSSIALDKNNSFGLNLNTVRSGNTTAQQPTAAQPENANENKAVAKPDLVIANNTNQQSKNVPVTAGNILQKTDTAGKETNKAYAVTGSRPGINMQQQTAKANRLPFTDDSTPAPKSSEKSAKTNRAVLFDIYAATYINYAKGSNNQFNVGAGFTSDIKLTENLKLSTGVSVGQNTLSYNTQPPSSAVMAAAAVPAVTNTYALKAASYYLVTAPSFKNYDASLIGLDVPVNLKYVFNPKKGDTYILAGLSSGTFINETYTYSYNSPSIYPSSSPTQDETTKSSFGSFYFAKTLNFAIGTGYPVGNNRLIIEPFLKYPLDGLGTQQLKFGAGGINLKFNFQVSKKHN
ncbi:MAG: hypothetical protein ACTHJ8_18990 [Mucilaginibacter sp.]